MAEQDGFLERAFRLWLARQRPGTDPDDPEEEYSYRGAFLGGERPDATGHWSSQFKTLNSPERYVDRDTGGYASPGSKHIEDSINGQEVHGALRRAVAGQLLELALRRQ